jgi:PucR family transcriptional regulator, purine catabolism regulatory protein
LYVAPTLRQVLALPEFKRGRPQLLAGAGQVDAPVRWVHVSELPDIAPLLRGGELILTTGIALSADERDLVRYVDELARAGASGLVIELGRRFDQLPDTLVRTAERRSLPLVALTREIPFVRITEAVHSIIVDSQVKLLQDSETVHRRFTALALEGADTPTILAAISELTGRPVVMENLAHQVLGYVAAGVPVQELLSDWESRSRFVRLTTATELVQMPEPWLVTTIGARGSHWGRLLMRLDADPSAVDLTSIDTVALERGAGALAMNRLMDREEASLERMTHRTLIDDIRFGTAATDEDIALRSAAVGVPLAQRRLAGAVARLAAAEDELTSEARLRDAAELVAATTRTAGLPALVGVAGADEVVFVVTLPLDQQAALTILDRAMRQVREAFDGADPEGRTGGVSLAIGSVVDQVGALRRSLSEARQVARAAPGLPVAKPYHELSDIHIRGLLYILGDDPHVQTFVEHELGPLLMHDSAHRTDLMGTLATFLGHGRNKSAAAEAAGMSRPAFYQRLSRIERILNTDLESVEACLSLHVAVLALDAMRAGQPGGPDLAS